MLPDKGPLEVLAVIDRLRMRGRSVHCVFAGEWISNAFRESFLQAVTDRDLAGHVECSGPVYGAEKAKLMRDADILVFPTRYPHEGLPLVILEAMAAGLPVVSTSIGAIPDAVCNGVTGLLVEPGRVEQLAVAVEKLVDDREARQRMGVAGRRQYLDNYTISHFEDRLRQAWLRALERPRHAGRSTGINRSRTETGGSWDQGGGPARGRTL
jgi:glycosyltransferase involved in cell wall biosynthesis